MFPSTSDATSPALARASSSRPPPRGCGGEPTCETSWAHFFYKKYSASVQYCTFERGCCQSQSQTGETADECSAASAGIPENFFRFTNSAFGELANFAAEPRTYRSTAAVGAPGRIIPSRAVGAIAVIILFVRTS